MPSGPGGYRRNSGPEQWTSLPGRWRTRLSGTRLPGRWGAGQGQGPSPSRRGRRSPCPARAGCRTRPGTAAGHSSPAQPETTPAGVAAPLAVAAPPAVVPELPVHPATETTLSSSATASRCARRERVSRAGWMLSRIWSPSVSSGFRQDQREHERYREEPSGQAQRHRRTPGPQRPGSSVCEFCVSASARSPAGTHTYARPTPPRSASPGTQQSGRT